MQYVSAHNVFSAELEMMLPTVRRKWQLWWGKYHTLDTEYKTV